MYARIIDIKLSCLRKYCCKSSLLWWTWLWQRWWKQFCQRWREHNEPVKYWPFKTVFYFHAILREIREVVKKPLVKVNHEDSLFPVSGLVTDQTGQNMCLYDDKSFRNKTTDRLQHYPHWLIIFIDRDNELTITFKCII